MRELVLSLGLALGLVACGSSTPPSDAGADSDAGSSEDAGRLDATSAGDAADADTCVAKGALCEPGGTPCCTGSCQGQSEPGKPIVGSCQ